VAATFALATVSLSEVSASAISAAAPVAAAFTLGPISLAYDQSFTVGSGLTCLYSLGAETAVEVAASAISLAAPCVAATFTLGAISLSFEQFIAVATGVSASYGLDGCLLFEGQSITASPAAAGFSLGGVALSHDQILTADALAAAFALGAIELVYTQAIAATALSASFTPGPFALIQPAGGTVTVASPANASFALGAASVSAVVSATITVSAPVSAAFTLGVISASDDQSLTVTAPVSATFALTATSFLYPLILAPGATATFHLTFTPTATGVRTGTLRFAANAVAQTVALSGTGSGAAALSRLSTAGNQIVDASGTPVQLKGVNWNGAEGSTFLPLGLWQTDYKVLVNKIKSWGMNCIRLPMSCALNSATVNSGGLTTSGINTDLAGLTALEIIDTIIAYAGSQGIWVYLDCHRLTAGNGTDSAISSSTLAQITAWWQTMATRYGSNPTVCGADLYNEPHTVDWVTLVGFYETIGNAIHAIAPDWLILCEGGAVPSGAAYGAWWGGALEGWASTPVTLNTANKVVASPHEYGQSVSLQTWLESASSPIIANWPANLNSVWQNNWAYLHSTNTVPLLIGEYGGQLGFNSGTGAADPTQVNAAYEVQWFDELISYMTENAISSTFWTLTSESADTGGLLCSDDQTPQAGKLALLAPLLA
jgi:aryl-phospho-beta-D-glucosidase BglC (GH1 family)